jgi:hypothetical protein
MNEVKRTPLIVLLAGLLGFTSGAAILGFAALFLGISLLRFAPGGIHSDWTLLVLAGTLVCAGLGGVAGATASARLAKSWRH